MDSWGLYDKEHKIFLLCRPGDQWDRAYCGDYLPGRRTLKILFCFTGTVPQKEFGPGFFRLTTKKFRILKKVIDRIVFSYPDKVELMHNILGAWKKAHDYLSDRKPLHMACRRYQKTQQNSLS